MKKLVFLIFMLIYSTILAQSDRTIIISGNGSVASDTAQVQCNHMFSATPDDTTWSSNTAHWGRYYNTRIPYVNFPTFMDSVGSDTLCDSAIIGIIVHGTFVESDAGDDFDPGLTPWVRRCLQNTSYYDVTYNSYASGLSWDTPGAWTVGTDVSTTMYATNGLKVGLTGAWQTTIDTSQFTNSDTIFFKLDPDTISAILDGTVTNHGFVIQFDTTAANNWYIYFTADAMMYLYVSESIASTSPPASASIDSLHNDFSAEQDSVTLNVITSSDNNYEKAILAWSTSGYPDSSNAGDTAEWVYVANTAFDTSIVITGTEDYTVYLSTWQYDDVLGWSSRTTATKVFSSATADTDPPDAHSLFEVMSVRYVNNDSVRIAIGSVDSTDYDSTIIRYDTVSIPTTITAGIGEIYNGGIIENDTSDYLISVDGQQWVYFTIFAADEVPNWNSGLSDSIYFPSASSSGGVWTQAQIDSLFRMMDTSLARTDTILKVVDTIFAVQDTMWDTIVVIASYTDTSLYAVIADVWRNVDTTNIDSSIIGDWLVNNLSSSADAATIWGYASRTLTSETWNGTQRDSILEGISDANMGDKIWSDYVIRTLTSETWNATQRDSVLSAVSDISIGDKVWSDPTTRALTELDEDNTTIDINGQTILSVSGSVGSVAGNVDGSVASVTGSVGSIGSGGITSSSYSAGAQDANSFASNCFTNLNYATSVWQSMWQYDTSLVASGMGGMLKDTLAYQGPGGGGATATQVWSYSLRSLTELTSDSTTIDLSTAKIGTTSVITDGVTVATNNDKTGYSLTQTFPTNFSDLTISATTGEVTVGTNNDKTGYSLTQSLPTNFSALSITTGGEVTVGTNNDKTGYSLTQTFPTNFSSLSIASDGSVVPADTTVSGDTLAVKKDSLIYQGSASGLMAADIWNVAFTESFVAGSMGDSLNNSSYVQGTAAGLTASEIWTYASGNGRTLTSLDEDLTTIDLNSTPLGSVVGSVGSVTGSVGSVSGNVSGNVTGSVGSVVGNVGGNVTGSVGSVVGNVGGNVSGNVDGSVGSIASNGITGSSIATSALDGKGDWVTSSDLPSNFNLLSIDGSGYITVGTNDDKTGYILAPSGLDVDTSFSQIQGAVGAIRDSVQYLVTAVDFATADGLDTLMILAGFKLNSKSASHYLTDMDSTAIISPSGDTLGYLKYYHTGQSAGFRPDSTIFEAKQ